MIKRSPIWRLPLNELKQLTANSTTFSQILAPFGLKGIGSNINTLKRRLDVENINYAHIPQGWGANKGRRVWNAPLIPDEELFIINSKHSRKTARRYILKRQLIPYQCAVCNLPPIWNNKPMTLTLDHINGINNDHRLVNLRFICPNCDTQSETYGSKKTKKRYNCKQCGLVTAGYSTLCQKCAQFKKIKDRPSKEQLEKLVWSVPTTTIAKQFGVTDNAVAKWCKTYGITKPGPGYWTKLHSKVSINH